MGWIVNWSSWRSNFLIDNIIIKHHQLAKQDISTKKHMPLLRNGKYYSLLFDLYIVPMTQSIRLHVQTYSSLRDDIWAD